jgi:hypothetical protein
MFMESIFKRYEKKYLITRAQGDALRDILARHMEPDCFSSYLVQNIYYDTQDWEVIRTSLERPPFKEKMRLRCYGVPDNEDSLYLELKKKYKGIVYKRRIAFPAGRFARHSVRDIVSGEDSQIARELGFYLQSRPVSERVYIAYRRVAFAGIGDRGLRVTLDSELCFRTEDLHFARPCAGMAILPESSMLMEVKTAGGMPMWLVNELSEQKIYPSAFSKYGTCYSGYICKGQWHIPTPMTAERDAKGSVRRSA